MLKKEKDYGNVNFALGIGACLSILALIIFMPFFIGRTGIEYPKDCAMISEFLDSNHNIHPSEERCWPVDIEEIVWYYIASWFRGFILLIIILSFCKGVQMFIDDIKNGKESYIYRGMKRACKAVYNFFTMIGIKISKRFKNGRE